MEKLDEEEQLVAAVGSDDEDDVDMDEEEEESDDESEEEGSESDMDLDGPVKKKPDQSTGLKKSAAALCVGMGSFSDPQDIPGLAHFLEHMGKRLHLHFKFQNSIYQTRDFW